MVIDKIRCVSEIQLIIGDLAKQFEGDDAMLDIELELQNTMLFLTSNFEFGWNTRRITGVTHTNGLITPPSGFGKVLTIVDSDKNENYFSATQQELLIIQNNADRAITWSQTQPIPYVMSVNELTGADQIELATGVSTPTALTFSMVYTQSTTTPATIWVPDRIRPYIISFTVSNLAAKVDNPDSNNLISYHDKIAKIHLTFERDFSNNRGVNKFNTNMRTSINTRLDTGSKYAY